MNNDQLQPRAGLRNALHSQRLGAPITRLAPLTERVGSRRPTRSAAATGFPIRLELRLLVCSPRPARLVASMPNITAASLLAATHKPPILPRVTSRVTPAVIGVATRAVIGDRLFATRAVIGVATPTATPVATPVEYRPAAILAATRASVSLVLLTIPAPQRTSLVWPMCRGSLARQTDRPVHYPPPHPSRARRRHPGERGYVHQ